LKGANPEKKVYAKEVMKANLERLAHLIKVCGFLLQTKVYLFWERRLQRFNLTDF
jgi:hypothetical protein